MMTSVRRWQVFAALVLLHGAGIVFAPDPLAPLIAGSIYLPLMPLNEIGVPVFSAAESGGWSALSGLGWATVIIVWGITWWAVAGLASWLWNRFVTSSSADEE